jgi:hypothetical protein
LQPAIKPIETAPALRVEQTKYPEQPSLTPLWNNHQPAALLTTVTISRSGFSLDSDLSARHPDTVGLFIVVHSMQINHRSKNVPRLHSSSSYLRGFPYHSSTSSSYSTSRTCCAMSYCAIHRAEPRNNLKFPKFSKSPHHQPRHKKGFYCKRYRVLGSNMPPSTMIRHLGAAIRIRTVRYKIPQSLVLGSNSLFSFATAFQALQFVSFTNPR